MSLEKELIELGMEPMIAKVVQEAKMPEIPKDETKLYKKYKEAGFTTQGSYLEKADSNLLWVKLLCETGRLYGNHLRYVNLGDEVIQEEVTKTGLLGISYNAHERKVKTKILQLIRTWEYEDIVPEKILDTIIKHKNDFNHFFIGVPQTIDKNSITKLIDPILLGCNDYNSDSYCWFAVLGVWGNDWYEVNLYNTSNQSKKTEEQ